MRAEILIKVTAELELAVKGRESSETSELLTEATAEKRACMAKGFTLTLH